MSEIAALCWESLGDILKRYGRSSLLANSGSGVFWDILIVYCTGWSYKDKKFYYFYLLICRRNYLHDKLVTKF